MIDDDTQRFLEWLDPLIDKTLLGEDTPLNWVIFNLIRNTKNCPLSAADAVCYIIIETINDVGPQQALDVLNIRFDREVTDDEMKDLLLQVPIQFLVWMTKKNPAV